MNIKKLDFIIVLFLVFTIISISSTISTDEAFSIRQTDYDNDGILDEDDECPLTSETFNKFEDTDGCPDLVSEEVTQYQFPDSDGDGVEDRFDACINLPETLNDYLDEDGCPEIIPDKFNGETDSDLDTIPDSFDVCPLEKENFNDFQDGDGCPDSYVTSSDDSQDSSLAYAECGFGKALVTRINSQNTDCINLDTAKKWESYGIVEIISESIPKEDTYVLPQIEDTAESELDIDLPVYPIPQDLPTDGVEELTPTVPSPVSLETVTSKMENLFELHRTQLLSTWDSMSELEKSDLVQMLDKMYEMMQSVDIRDHMKHMSMMNETHQDYKDDKYGMKEKQSEHGCSCGEGDLICESGAEGCTCSEDGICTCDENCVCTSCS